MSTRPDYISKEIVEIFKKYTITFVELGIQSMNDEVLSYLKRGHTVKDTENAISLLNDARISFVGQMMIGLPTATLEDEMFCAEKICELGASSVRIYPTLVFKSTELEQITMKGEYIPLTCEEAVSRSAEVFKIFLDNNVPCIRIGLNDSENLHSDETFVAGPNEPSIGEMVKSRYFYNTIREKLFYFKAKNIIIECSKGKTSQVIGNKRFNVEKLKDEFGLKEIKVIENGTLNQYDINIYEKEETTCV